MTDQSITSLIEKLEGAETGSRELDWLIADATGHPSFARKIEGIWPPFMERSRADKDVPAYSTSIDTALALASRVLPGGLKTYQLAGFFGGHAASLGDGAPTSAATPALALCAAILRAKGADQ